MIAFLLTPIGRAVACGLAFLAFLFMFALHQRSIGAAKAVAKIEKATTNAVSKANAAGDRSRDPSARGVRDPYSLD